MEKLKIYRYFIEEKRIVYEISAYARKLNFINYNQTNIDANASIGESD